MLLVSLVSKTPRLYREKLGAEPRRGSLALYKFKNGQEEYVCYYADALSPQLPFALTKNGLQVPNSLRTHRI